MTVKDQDFNWVEARQKCSIGVEFLKLRCQAKKNFEERQASLNPRKQRLATACPPQRSKYSTPPHFSSWQGGAPQCSFYVSVCVIMWRYVA